MDRVTGLSVAGIMAGLAGEIDATSIERNFECCGVAERLVQVVVK
jgi:hypothetical protein